MLLIQSCQGQNHPEQHVEINMHTDGNGNNTDALGMTPDSTEDPKTHIKVKRPNTIVVCATPPSFSATRHLFLQHMAKQFRESDGKTVFTSMVNACSRQMSQDRDATRRAQAPITTSLTRLDLILPRALMYDRLPETQGK